MASYFDEHDCEPLGDGQQPNHLLHFVRLLLQTQILDTDEYESLLGGRPTPPTSKAIIEGLEKDVISECDEALKKTCPVCLAGYSAGVITNTLPCGHTFHNTCIVPWLEKTNTCPVCRHELPTDDPDYEEQRKHKLRAKQREYELDSLHTSMYG